MSTEKEELLKSLLESDNPEVKEDISIVLNFLIKKLEKILKLENPIKEYIINVLNEIDLSKKIDIFTIPIYRQTIQGETLITIQDLINYILYKLSSEIAFNKSLINNLENRISLLENTIETLNTRINNLEESNKTIN